MNLLSHLQTHQVVELEEPKILFKESVSHFDNHKTRPYYNRVSAVEGINNSDNAINLISSNKKAIGFMPPAFFHYFADFVAFILHVSEQEPGCEIIIDDTIMLENMNFKDLSFHEFAYKMMDDLGIKYRTISNTDNTIVNIDNFLIIDGYGYQHYVTLPKKILAYIEKYIIKDPVEPFRKVYLSRSSKTENISSRVEDEEAMENFFKSKGFEVVSIDSFTNIEDQIRFFYEAKVICGVTGSGLTNMLFTRDGQIAIELVTVLGVPSIVPEGNTLWHFHNFYKMISFSKNQTLINIPNYRQDSKSLIELISKHLDILGEL